MQTNAETESFITGKMVVLGDQGVGKTSLVLRYVEKEYNKYISPTIGASYFSCSIKIKNVTVKLQIWDTAGQERFKAMAPMFYRNATCALLLFDITRPESFENMQKWVTELRGNVENVLVICIVGCKLDLAHKRKVSRDEASQYSKRIGAIYHECSALKDQGIEQIFKNVALEVVKSSGLMLVNASTQNEGESLVAVSSELSATDVGTVVVLRGSKETIAYGDAVKNKCC